MILRRILTILFLIEFGVVSLVCYGQNKDLNSSPVLDQIFTEWNNKEHYYYKGNYDKDFKQYISQQGKLYSSKWRTERTKLWGELPSTLTPKLRLSSGAEQLLESLYSENATEFTKTYENRDSQDFQMKVKLYLVFSLAQKYAIESNSDEIQPSHVFRAVMAAFTGVWPFCPRKNSRGEMTLINLLPIQLEVSAHT